MLTKNERMSKLNNAGINTGKYFVLDMGDGKKVNIIIDANGNPVKVEDPIETQIIADGYVRNTKLHRRFVMAQMFQALNYKSYNGMESGYNAWLARRSFKYTFDMMLEEIRVLSELEKRDRETFLERSHFFTREVIAQTINDYLEQLQTYVRELPVKNCKGIPYKRVKRHDIFVEDLPKKLYIPVRMAAASVVHARNYGEIYRIVRNFMRTMVKLAWDTPKSKAWVDAYKGEGAFYTLKNLVMFHNCSVEDFLTGELHSGLEAVDYLNAMLGKYQGEGWRMFALLKKTIEVNNFDFNERMNEIYND